MHLGNQTIPNNLNAQVNKVRLKLDLCRTLGYILLLFFFLVHLFSFSYFSSGVVLISVFYMCNAGEINNSLHLTNYGEGILAIFFNFFQLCWLDFIKS